MLNDEVSGSGSSVFYCRVKIDKREYGRNERNSVHIRKERNNCRFALLPLLQYDTVGRVPVWWREAIG